MTSSTRYKWHGTGRKILLTVTFLVLGAVFVFGKQGLLKWYQLKRMSRQMELRNDSLETAIQELSGSIRSLEAGDSLELERLARHWGMVREGEEIYIIRDKEDTTQTSPR